MGRARIPLACAECGTSADRWVGRCPSCDAWGSIQERPTGARGGSVPILERLGSTGDADRGRLPTGFPGVDRVLGGGVVPGSVVLVAGEPGIGKSTLLLHMIANLFRSGQACLVASGEESRHQVASRARRMGLPDGFADFVPGRELPGVLQAARTARPSILAVDSIQSIRDPEHPSLPGGVTQVRRCADALVGVAKEEGIAVLLAGQVTKDGEIAGPRTLEHAVDVVCSFDGDPRTGLRVLAAGKNRFGPEGELAWFEMGPHGLSEADPAALLAPRDGEAGAATALLTAGRRAVAVEVQALTVPAHGPPRRHVSGLDPRRFGLVAAVVESAGGFRLSGSELYGAAAGGLRVEDPGCDLAVAAALASAASRVPPPPGAAFVGELSLTGTVRATPSLPARIAAAAAAGIRTVYAPHDAPSSGRGVRVLTVRHVREAVRWAENVPHDQKTASEALAPSIPVLGGRQGH